VKGERPSYVRLAAQDRLHLKLMADDLGLSQAAVLRGLLRGAWKRYARYDRPLKEWQKELTNG
jgi:hypothetical protein